MLKHQQVKVIKLCYYAVIVSLALKEIPVGANTENIGGELTFQLIFLLGDVTNSY